MIKNDYSKPTSNDPITELFDAASALLFLEDALDSLDQSGAKVRTTGAAYVTGLVGQRVSDLAEALWDNESQPDAAAHAARLSDPLLHPIQDGGDMAAPPSPQAEAASVQGPKPSWQAQTE